MDKYVEIDISLVNGKLIIISFDIIRYRLINNYYAIHTLTQIYV